MRVPKAPCWRSLRKRWREGIEAVMTERFRTTLVRKAISYEMYCEVHKGLSES